MNNWLSNQGQNVLKEIGIKKDHFVLDIGCGKGNYSIPAAYLIGKKGKVYSADKSKESLKELRKKIRIRKLSNIEILDKEINKNISLKDESTDVVLLYDVLHLMKNRKSLYMEISRILKPCGILSVYPKHYDTEMNMNLEDIKREIESNGFILYSKLLKTLLHSGKLEKGYILNFRKT